MVYEEIIHFWKNQIHKYIVHYSFMGARVDAVKHLPPKVQFEIYGFIKQCCVEKHECNPIIYAEVLANEDLEQVSKDLMGLGITHVMNFLYDERFTLDYRIQRAIGCNREFWEAGPHGDLHVIDSLAKLRKVGGTVGYVGSHDKLSLVDAALTDEARSRVERKNHYAHRIRSFWHSVEEELAELKKLSIIKQTYFLKEKIAAVAFTSDSGWCMLSGDEYGHPGRKWVFDFYQPYAGGDSFNNRWGEESKFNLCEFIKEVNRVLSLLPIPPINSDFWVQHIVLESNPELMVIVRHHGYGYDGDTCVVVVNLSEKPCLDFNREVFFGTIIKKATNRESDSIQKAKSESAISLAIQRDHIYFLGVDPHGQKDVFEIKY